MKKIYQLAILIILITMAGCKKDTSFNNVDLMEGAYEFTGSYPNVAPVDFIDNGKARHVSAFQGQYILFFKAGTSIVDAGNLINAQGGIILAQIPQIGFYLIENNVTPANSFISSLQSNPLIGSITPNVPAYPKAGALILDHCFLDHGIEVKASLTSCYGSSNQCKDITAVKNNIIYGSPTAITHGIVDEANKNKSGPTYINLSFNGGLSRDTEYDFANLTPAEQDTFENNYYYFMTNVLMSVAAVRAEYRQNLVITIAAGNENYDMTAMLDHLRLRPGMTEILRDNVLIVSTEKIPGIHANYSYTDPDVVVLNNDSARNGSSFAAPCALGYIQDIVAKKGCSAKEALKAMKDASWILPYRVVELNYIKGMINAEYFMTSSKTLIGYSYISDCKFKMEYQFDNIQLAWNGSSGVIKMPVTLFWSLPLNPTNDCQTGTEPSATTEMFGELTGTDNAITTVTRIAGKFKFTIPNIQGPPIEEIPQFFSLKFTGKKNSNGTITGTISCAQEVPSLSFPETLQVTLTK